MKIREGFYKNRAGTTVKVKLTEDIPGYPFSVFKGGLGLYMYTVDEYGRQRDDNIKSSADLIEYLNPEEHPELYL